MKSPIPVRAMSRKDPSGIEEESAMNRRTFLRNSLFAGAGLLIVENSSSVRGASANEKLNVALIGVGGRGNWFVSAIPNLGENLVALCDVDDTKNPAAYERLPKAKRYYDYRKMLTEMDGEIDAVVVAAPDHIHAPASIMAMKMGKPVYCEKPLTHTIHEARVMRETAAKCKVATQMGNQGTASPAFRQGVDLIGAGALGEVREVHAWIDSGGPGPRQRPVGPQPIPDFFKWNLWLGPAAERSYHRDWVRGWHTWRDFGTCNLGNWAPHTLNEAFLALRLNSLWPADVAVSGKAPAERRVRVQAEVSEIEHDSFPRWEIVHWDFPARGDLPPVRVNWYNGGGSGFRTRIEDLLGRKLDWGDAGEKKWQDWAGLLIVGSQGMLSPTRTTPCTPCCRRKGLRIFTNRLPPCRVRPDTSANGSMPAKADRGPCPISITPVRWRSLSCWATWPRSSRRNSNSTRWPARSSITRKPTKRCVFRIVRGGRLRDETARWVTLVRSADFPSAVSQMCNLHGAAAGKWPAVCRMQFGATDFAPCCSPCCRFLSA